MTTTATKISGATAETLAALAISVTELETAIRAAKKLLDHPKNATSVDIARRNSEAWIILHKAVGV